MTRYYYRAALTWNVPTVSTEDDPEEAYLSVADSFVDLIVDGTEKDVEEKCANKGPLQCVLVEGTSREAVEAATYSEPYVELPDGSKCWPLGHRPGKAGIQYQLLLRTVDGDDVAKVSLHILRAVYPRSRARSVIKKSTTQRRVIYICRLCKQKWAADADDRGTIHDNANKSDGHLRWCLPTVGIDLIEEMILSKE